MSTEPHDRDPRAGVDPGRRRPGRSLLYVAAVAGVSLVAVLVWGLSSPDDPAPSDGAASGPTTTPATGAPSPSPPGPDAPPVPEPASGAYLGTFVNTTGLQRGGTLKLVLDELPELTRQIGRSPAIVAAYQPWKGPWVRNENLRAVAEDYGAIPMVSWSCGPSNEEIAAGASDDLVVELAEQLKAYGGPVLLRWFWEANLPIFPACLGPGTPAVQAAHYVDAFRHIVELFEATGADNVAFVWAPSVIEIAAPMTSFFPGERYVDWIGADGYDRDGGTGAFADTFSSWYGTFSGYGKPMMIAETGSTWQQTQYLQDIATTVPRDFPRVKAVVYFDAVGSYVDWRLGSYGGAGVSAFAALGRDPHFTAMPGR